MLLEKKYKLTMTDDLENYEDKRVNGLAFCQVLEKLGVIRSQDKHDVGLVLDEYGIIDELDAKKLKAKEKEDAAALKAEGAIGVRKSIDGKSVGTSSDGGRSDDEKNKSEDKDEPPPKNEGEAAKSEEKKEAKEAKIIAEGANKAK